MIEGWFLLPLCFALMIAAAALAGPARAGRAAAMALVTANLAAPLLAPADALMWRFIIGMYCGLGWMRVIELWKLGPGLTAPQRVWRLLAFYDARKGTSGPRVIDGAAVVSFFAYTALMAAGVSFAVVLGRQYDGPVHWAMRWFGGVVGVYGFLDASAAMLTAMHKSMGLYPPPLHDRPILATSVSEFWGSRWNLTVSAYFRAHLLWPMARRRHALVGAMLAFVASGVLHAYIVAVSVGGFMTLTMFAFFIAQIALVLIERRARIREWPRPLARVWTIGSLLVLSPLFIEPTLRVWDPLLAGI